MKHDTNAITGATLDAAVAIAEGLQWHWLPWGPDRTPIVGVTMPEWPSRDAMPYQPTLDWGVIGKLVDRDKGVLFRALPGLSQLGADPRTELCRAVVAAKLGPSVEIPPPLVAPSPQDSAP